MKIKYTLAALIATSLTASAVTFTVDNYIGEPNGDPGGAVANVAVQSFTPNIAGLGVGDTITADSPLPSTVYLEQATFLRAVSGDATAGSLFLNVYMGSGDDGIFLGSSTNAIDVNSAAGLASMVWSFGHISIDSTAEHAFVWSTTNTADSSVAARIQVARDSGGGFGDSYTGGTADLDTDNSSPLDFDTRFEIQTSILTIPEPSSATLLGLGGLALILRRRK